MWYHNTGLNFHPSFHKVLQHPILQTQFLRAGHPLISQKTKKIQKERSKDRWYLLFVSSKAQHRNVYDPMEEIHLLRKGTL